MYLVVTEEEENDKKKEEKEGIQLVSAVIDFVKNLDSDIKMNISSSVSAIIKQVRIRGRWVDLIKLDWSQLLNRAHKLVDQSSKL